MADLPPLTELSRSETITALSHYYRAEVTRSLAWRERLDLTTNWAVGAAAAFLGFAFSHPEIQHTVFFFAVAIVYNLMFIEARRYRFYDAYEYRVRLLHQNFIYGVLTRKLEIEDNTFWVAELASDLRYPQYKMDFLYALSRRFNANYIHLFGILLAGWLFKIKVHPVPAHSWREYLQQAAVGGLSGWFTFLFILLFIIHAVILFRHGLRPRGGRDILFARPPQGGNDLSVE